MWRLIAVVGVVLAVLGENGSGRAWAQAANDALIGRWIVTEPVENSGTALSALEVRAANSRGDLAVTGLIGTRNSERTWGTGRLEDIPNDSTPGRWRRASWSSGATNVLVQFRPLEDGHLLALLRERRDGSERVRQVLLSMERGNERLVSGRERPRELPRPSSNGPGTPTSKADAAGLFVIGSEGSGLRCVVEPVGFVRAAHPAWSPDGATLAFAGFDTTGRDPLIFLIPARGGMPRAVAAGISPTFSRDGSRLAYVASGRPEWATDWNSPGRNEERIEAVTLSGPDAGRVEVLGRGLWPRWAPTDDRLAFSTRRDANWDVFVRSGDGLSLTRLTDDPSLDTRPVWARDGRSVMFLSNRLNRWDLYRVSSEGREAAVKMTNHLRREEQADLSPDGRSVAFTDRPGRPDSRILILDLAGESVRTLTDQANADRDPAWSPDGRSIAFVSRRTLPAVTASARPMPPAQP